MCPYSTVPHPLRRVLMLWLVIALQALMPFIHAHAGAVHLSHSGFLNTHQAAHGDVAYHAISTGEHGAEIEVAQGMLLRHAAKAVAEAQSVAPCPLQPAAIVDRPAACPSALPPHLPLLPDHAFPLALAPPLR